MHFCHSIMSRNDLKFSVIYSQRDVFRVLILVNVEIHEINSKRIPITIDIFRHHKNHKQNQKLKFCQTPTLETSYMRSDICEDFRSTGK